MEAFDGIEENLALIDLPQNGCAIVHSDSDEGIQRLNQEAAKAMTRGARVGLTFRGTRDPLDHRQSREGARHRRTHRHARGRQDGRRRDLESRSFSVYALAEQVFIDGVLMYDRANRRRNRVRFPARAAGTRRERHEKAHRHRAAGLRGARRSRRTFDPRRHSAHVAGQGTLTNADVLVRDGKIAPSAPDSRAPGATIVEAKGRR